MKTPCIYILTNKPKGTLYIGVTSNLPARIYQHKNGFVDSFRKNTTLPEACILWTAWKHVFCNYSWKTTQKNGIETGKYD